MPDDNIEDGEEDEPRPESHLDGAVDTSTSITHHSRSKTHDAQYDGSEPTVPNKNEIRGEAKHTATTKNGVTSWFAIPAPLKRLFDHFPLVAYAESALPIRAARTRVENALYIFTSEKGALSGHPSFNPSCLKWQTFLKMTGIPFRTIQSNNHASPSGSLPFLMVGSKRSNERLGSALTLAVPELVPGSRMKKWVKEQSNTDKMLEPDDIRYDAYVSLLDNRIRSAWLYQLYLHPANEPVVKRLYVAPCSSNPLVQMTVASQLRSAAAQEIIKVTAKSGNTPRLDEVEIMREADEAFGAMSALLGDAEWFFGSPMENPNSRLTKAGPTLLDASVFAYTHLVLDSQQDGDGEVIYWNENPLKALLERYENLVRHRERILRMYY